ncbi:MAG: ribonuclease J [Clostridiaceae bacterium]|nr:ribonuclease J [Clostridiaceae bacterium]
MLKVIPLGGMREIGKNMTVYECGQDMILVDCGLAFPEDDMPGIDVVIPDFSYVIQNKQKLRGIFLTHGHEDHIGALPWLCKEVHVPIYGNQLTLELVRLKLEDRGSGAAGVSLNPIKDGSVITVGSFSVEFIHINHSIADANALVIRTPAGIVYHSGDFKIDYTPINGGPMDLSRIAAIGSENVLLMVCESTNVEKKGYSPSESKVGETFADLFGKAAGRIFVTTFSSNVFRIQQIFTAAEQYGRKVALIGRSMLNYFNAANTFGYITMKPDTLIDVTQIDRYDGNELVLITTGSQGEPMSALTRMAFSEHRRVEIIPGDTVILSSSAIPGNEKSVYRVINELYKRGAKVIYESLSEIHVSGHAYQEELKLLHQLLKPRYFIPAHGEYRHLYRHAELAHQLGQPWDQIFLLNNGDIFEYQNGTARIGGYTNAAGVLIDGSSMGDVDNLVLRDRRLLADDGVVAIFLAVSRLTGDFAAEPDIQARGFIYESETDQVIKECQKKISAFARKASSGNKPLAAMIRSGALRDQLRDLLFDRTQRRPVILISLIEV